MTEITITELTSASPFPCPPNIMYDVTIEKRTDLA